MRPIDGVGALNPALQTQANLRVSEAPTPRATKVEPISDASKSVSTATVSTNDPRSDHGVFKPVVAPSDASGADLPNTYKSGNGSLDILL